MRNSIEKVLTTLSKLEAGKMLHFFYGFYLNNIILLIVSSTCSEFTLMINMFIAFTITLLIATLKEVYDFVSPIHEASFMDIWFGLLPATTQIIIVLLYHINYLR